MIYSSITLLCPPINEKDYIKSTTIVKIEVLFSNKKKAVKPEDTAAFQVTGQFDQVEKIVILTVYKSRGESNDLLLC